MLKLKFTLQGALRGTPFDESVDHWTERTPAYSHLVSFGVIAIALLSFIALVLAVSDYNDMAIKIYSGAVFVSLMTAGLQWYAGFKVRALNQLFTLVFTSLLMTVNLLLIHFVLSP